WVLAAADHGVPYLWRADGTHGEILPRGVVGQEVFRTVKSVVGVVGGFVVKGQLREHPVLVHYDLISRTCVCHVPDVAPGRWYLQYSPLHHAVILHTPAREMACSLDLGTGAWHRSWDFSLNLGAISRASVACDAWRRNQLPPHALWVTHKEIRGE